MEPATVLEWLIAKYPASKRHTLKRMIESGRVRINGRRVAKLKQPLSPGDRVEVTDRTAQRPPAPVPTATTFGIVYEDDDILVVNKPAGLLTSTVPRERRPTLLANVRQYLAHTQPHALTGLIHRLDRDASGLLIFSKNPQAYESLKSQFFHHDVKREYRVVVHGSPKPATGQIESRLIERADGTVHSTKQIGKGQRAITEYKVLKTQGKLSLVRVILHTGRKHQIRVHMAERGTPVVGDTVYGPPKAAARLMLNASRLAIRHPRTDEEMTFTAPLPAEFPVREE